MGGRARSCDVRPGVRAGPVRPAQVIFRAHSRLLKRELVLKARTATRLDRHAQRARLAAALAQLEDALRSAGQA